MERPNIGADVVISHNPGGRVTGEAYVAFHSESEMTNALRKDRAEIGGRYVEIFVCQKEEFKQQQEIEKVCASGSLYLQFLNSMQPATNTDYSHQKTYVRMRGFQFEFSACDVLTFLGKAGLVLVRVHSYSIRR